MSIKYFLLYFFCILNVYSIHDSPSLLPISLTNQEEPIIKFLKFPKKSGFARAAECVYNGETHKEGEEWDYYITDTNTVPYYGFHIACIGGQSEVKGCYENQLLIPLGSKGSSKVNKGYKASCTELGLDYEKAEDVCQGHDVGDTFDEDFYRYECTETGLIVINCLDSNSKVIQTNEEFTANDAYRMKCMDTPKGKVVEGIYCLDEGKRIDLGKDVRNGDFMKTCLEERSPKGFQTAISLNVTHCCEPNSDHCVKIGSEEKSTVIETYTFHCTKQGDEYNSYYTLKNGEIVTIPHTTSTSVSTVTSLLSSSTTVATSQSETTTFYTTSYLSSISTTHLANTTTYETTINSTISNNSTVSSSNKTVLSTSPATSNFTNATTTQLPTTETSSGSSTITFDVTNATTTQPYTTETSNGSSTLTFDVTNATTTQSPTTETNSSGTTTTVASTTTFTNTETTLTSVPTSTRLQENTTSTEFATSPSVTTPENITSSTLVSSTDSNATTPATTDGNITTVLTTTFSPSSSGTVENITSNTPVGNLTTEIVTVANISASTEEQSTETSFTTTLQSSTQSLVISSNVSQSTEISSSSTVVQNLTNGTSSAPVTYTTEISSTPTQLLSSSSLATSTETSTGNTTTTTAISSTPNATTLPNFQSTVSNETLRFTSLNSTNFTSPNPQEDLALPVNNLLGDTTLNLSVATFTTARSESFNSNATTTFDPISKPLNITPCEIVYVYIYVYPNKSTVTTTPVTTVTPIQEVLTKLPETPQIIYITKYIYPPGYNTNETSTTNSATTITTATHASVNTTTVTVKQEEIIEKQKIIYITKYIYPPGFSTDGSTTTATTTAATATVEPKPTANVIYITKYIYPPGFSTERPQLGPAVVYITKYVTVEPKPENTFVPQETTLSSSKLLEYKTEIVYYYITKEPVKVPGTPQIEPSIGLKQENLKQSEIVTYITKYITEQVLENPLATPKLPETPGYSVNIVDIFRTKEPVPESTIIETIKKYVTKENFPQIPTEPEIQYATIIVTLVKNETVPLFKTTEPVPRILTPPAEITMEEEYITVIIKIRKVIESGQVGQFSIGPKIQYVTEYIETNRVENFIPKPGPFPTKSLSELIAIERNDRCQVGWLLFGNKCFFISPPESRGTSDQARQTCERGGGQLAVIESKEEMEFLKKMLTTVQGTYPGRAFDGFWIGLYLEETTKTWQWVREGGLKKIPWLPNPGNIRGRVAVALNVRGCGEIRWDTIDWGVDKDHCMHRQWFICGAIARPETIVTTAKPAEINYDIRLKCTNDWVPFENHCYFFSKKESRLDNKESDKVCNNEGGYLLVINSQQELDFVSYEVESRRHSMPDESFDGYWVGLMKNKDSWSWSKPNDFKIDWLPENVEKMWELTEESKFDANHQVICGELRYNYQKWGLDKDHCLHQEAYVCEKDLLQSPGDCNTWQFACPKNAECVKILNESRCICKIGYKGDGYNCVAQSSGFY